MVTLPGRVENLRINVQLLEIDKHAIDIDVFLLNRIACRVQCERFFFADSCLLGLSDGNFANRENDNKGNTWLNAGLIARVAIG